MVKRVTHYELFRHPHCYFAPPPRLLYLPRSLITLIRAPPPFSPLPPHIPFASLFSSLVLPNPHPYHDPFLLSQFLQSLQRMYSPQMRKNMRHFSFWVWIDSLNIIFNSCKHSPENLLFSKI